MYNNNCKLSELFVNHYVYYKKKVVTSISLKIVDFTMIKLITIYSISIITH